MRRTVSIVVVAGLALLIAAAPAAAAPKKERPARNDRTTTVAPSSSTSTSTDTAPSRRSTSATSGQRPSGGAAGGGNAGSTKIASPGDDHHPDNDPKQGCSLRVDFYGFRVGTLDLTIAAIPPTGTAVLVTDRIVIDEPARGNEHQASRTYDLTDELEALGPLGRYHVKVSAKRVGSGGNGAKHKVLWMRCEPGTAAEPEVETTPSPAATPTPASTVRAGGTTVPEVRPTASTPLTRVLGARYFRHRVAIAGGAVHPARLATTGASLLGLLRWGLLFAASGALVLGLQRRFPARRR